jgi:hypothetical protein
VGSELGRLSLVTSAVAAVLGVVLAGDVVVGVGVVAVLGVRLPTGSVGPPVFTLG